MINMDAFVQDIQRDEGFRSFLYDDATGQRIRSGDTLKGNPTIGNGWNVSAKTLTQSQWATLTGWLCENVKVSLTAAFPWVANLNEPRARALANMAYNMGVAKLAEFQTFLELLQQGKFSEAATDLRSTLWAKQVGDRATRIADIIEKGV